jgi:hypothetical protein
MFSSIPRFPSSSLATTPPSLNTNRPRCQLPARVSTPTLPMTPSTRPRPAPSHRLSPPKMTPHTHHAHLAPPRPKLHSLLVRRNNGHRHRFHPAARPLVPPHLPPHSAFHPQHCFAHPKHILITIVLSISILRCTLYPAKVRMPSSCY